VQGGLKTGLYAALAPCWSELPSGFEWQHVDLRGTGL